MLGRPYATLEEVLEWAEPILAREPDLIIGENYLHRWHVVPRNELCNLYLHRFFDSDDGRALHDHPWDNTSVVLKGKYFEHTPGGIYLRGPGDVVVRHAEDKHRIELLPDKEDVVTLFFTGPRVREWGFACPEGWVDWKTFHQNGGCAG